MRKLPPTLVLLVLTVSFVSVAVAGKSDGHLDLYWVDVEGGAATLIVTPQDECVLIDTGNPGLRDSTRVSKVVGKIAGLQAIDHLIVTHYHRDHYGGAEVLSSMLPIKKVYDNGVFAGMPDNPGKAYFNFRCDERHVIQPGEAIDLKQAATKTTAPKVEMVCLGARKSFVDPTKVDAARNEKMKKLHRDKDRDGSDNANSIVMLVRFGPFEFFDGGDVTWNQEKQIVYPFNLPGEVDVYQVTHHGLDSSNNPILLSSLKPRVAIMNNGHTKGCMPEVFANLKATPSIEAIYQVHKNLRPDGVVNNVPDDFIANHQDSKNCQGHYIKLSVEPDGAHYTVAIPAHNIQRRYKTK
ncbi:MAG: MBL fold metallo-hydrolase [Pirellulaceae bacterium]|nr:MBL fold metallo-hydrolase [Pirellulaceae bacterium]